MYHCLGALSWLVGPLAWNAAVRQSGAAGAWWLAAGGGNLLGVRSGGTTSGVLVTNQHVGPGRRPWTPAGLPVPPTPLPLETCQKINHLGLFDDPSLSHATGGDFFFFFFAKLRGEKENVISIKKRSQALIWRHRKRISSHSWKPF